MKQTKQRKTRTDQEILSALEEFEAAGNTSIKEFAAALQISPATFYSWRRKYKNLDQQAIATGRFLPVDLSEIGSGELKGPIFAEYRGIIFYQPVDAAYLKALL